MEGATPSVLCSHFVVMLILLLPDTSVAEPRSQIIQLICGNRTTVSVPNFVGTMETLSEQVRARGYGVAVTGTGPDATYGISQCYGDLSLLDCVLCFSEARTLIPQCFPYNGARIYLDGCFMRAENYSFYDEYLGPEDRRVCGNRTTKGSLFQQNARAAVQQAVENAPSNNGYASSQVSFLRDSNDTAYVLADCWKTLSANSCAACLQNASASMLGCLPWSEGRALYTGCFMRYSDTNFLNAITTNGGKVVVTIIVVSSVVVLGVGAFIGIGVWKNKLIQKKRKGANDAEKLVKILHDISLNFKYSTLDKATGSFDEANKLGQGGFGTVYKGVLADGREIAVKRLFFNNKHRVADFYNEVNIVSSIEHKNLIRLLGCCCSGPESLLVYEFLPNQSLDHFIFDPIKGKALNWEKRFEIIIGTAEGLIYLHENTKTRIIHRDIKASNILLDSRLRAKIADFGLARSFQEGKSHISTVLAGTLGYMAPEYLARGQLTEKADVYSFGVLLLEIVTGKKNNKRKNDEDTVSLVSDVWEHFQRGIVEELFDLNLMLHNCHTINVQNEVARVLHVGLLCTQAIPTLRPFMSKALKMLVKKDEELPPPTKPPFVDEKTMELHDPWEDYSLKQGSSSSIANLSHTADQFALVISISDSKSGKFVAKLRDSRVFHQVATSEACSSGEMERETPSILCSLFVIVLILLIPDTSVAESISQIVQIICGNETGASVTNYMDTTKNISQQMRTRGYGVAVTGTGLVTNYALAQCYSNLSLVDCVLCFSEAETLLPQCYPYNGRRIYLDGCFFRVDNYMFYDQYLGPEDRHICGNRTTKGTLFQQNARRAVQQAVANAPSNDGYARAEVSVPGPSNETAYVLADCWKTLSANSCAACLQNASASMLGCLPWSEGRALYTGCFMRYSDTNFLNDTSTSGGWSSRGKVVVIVIVVVISSVVVLGAAAFVGFGVWKNKQIQKKRKGKYFCAKNINDVHIAEYISCDLHTTVPRQLSRINLRRYGLLMLFLGNLNLLGANDVEKLVKILHKNSLNFKYSTLDKATGSFDEANKLGQGGFGTVYKGVLADGREIAVKRLFFNNKHRAADFYNEVNIISSVQHKNLTRLLGCSCSGPESLLVYELLPNQSLDRFIFDPIKGKALNWEKRFEIIIGTAEGMVYLHENTNTRIIHRDIKASNILLDSRLRAKIADFGLARSFQADKSHISTAIAGTLGYMAPEYLAHGQLTEKADVYSFGVLLLEIVTGSQNNKRKNAEYTVSLVSNAWEHFQRGIVEELFDPNLMLHNYHTINVKNEVARVLHVGLLCTQEIPTLRPSMSEALQMFVKKDEELPPPTKPPFVDEKTMELHDPWEMYSLKQGDSATTAHLSHSSFYPR
ncbi:hypothetical protein H5410_000477 [Solanum commersonii]|uniref:Cysteine-rich receptor-like protein kinase 2 n=1 Tax=Solanum commersonii TaxID=4109 RepID=A0A9J6AW98_SOLCO|nr:hypothetical protein H5410_000477 [Solanum commersonii]